MEIKLIDFNAKFAEEYFAWCKQHPEAVADEDKVDDLYFDMLDAWLDKPQSWLDGMSPNGYFHAIEDPQMLVSILIEYLREEIELPDPLLHCILHHKDEIVPIFHGILMADESPDMQADELLDIQAEIIHLLRELDAKPLYIRYLTVMSTLDEECAYAEAACEALEDGGEDVKELLYEAYPDMKGYCRSCIIDLLSSLLPDERTLAILKDAWREGEEDEAFLAECMGRYGDEAALPLLRQAAAEPNIDYYLFKELKNAIEAISGEEIPERDFYGDKLFDMLASEDEDGN
ncbi:MAG: hypothetical protein IJP03_05735 [Christensenellaceae bacterium]|nr:hypothetical protein [Christensenellaceae bacterium]